MVDWFAAGGADVGVADVGVADDADDVVAAAVSNRLDVVCELEAPFVTRSTTSTTMMTNPTAPVTSVEIGTRLFPGDVKNEPSLDISLPPDPIAARSSDSSVAYR